MKRLILFLITVFFVNIFVLFLSSNDRICIFYRFHDHYDSLCRSTFLPKDMV